MHHVCSGFHFFPTFESGRYKANFLPTECLPVPNNDNRECVVGGRIFTTMDGRGERRMFLLGTQACIGITPTKKTCCSLKKRVTRCWFSEKSSNVTKGYEREFF